MKIYGKATEYRAALFEAVTPFGVTVANVSDVSQPGTFIPWPTDLADVEIYDTQAYTYDPLDPTFITVLKAGIYEVSYSINSLQFSSSNRHTPVCSVWKTPNTGIRERVMKTITTAYLRNRNSGSNLGTNSYRGPIKMPTDNTRIQLDIRVLRTNAVRIQPNEASISLRLLRPLLQGET